VKLVDANILIYAWDLNSPHHPACKTWLEGHLNSRRKFGIPWASSSLAIEHGLVLCSTDSDFAKYKDITWENPLE